MKLESSSVMRVIMNYLIKSAMIVAPALTFTPSSAQAFPQPPDFFKNYPLVILEGVTDYSTLEITASQGESSFPVVSSLETNGDGILLVPSDDPETTELEGLAQGAQYTLRAQGAGLTSPVYLSSNPDGSLQHTHQVGGFHTDKQFLEGASPSGVYNPAQAKRTGNPYPNPFNPIVHIPISEFSIDDLVQSTVTIYDVAGRQVHSYQETGSIEWNGKNQDGKDVASGTYIFRIQFNDTQMVETRKVKLIR